MGIAQIAALGKNPSSATISIEISTGPQPENVTGASGFTESFFDVVSITGGTPPYSYTWVRTNGDSGKLRFTGDIHASWVGCYYSGFSVGESTACFARCDIVDSLGNSGSSKSDRINVRRIS